MNASLVVAAASGLFIVSLITRVEGQGAFFDPTGSMNTPRTQHTAQLLLDGHVLIIGGSQIIDGDAHFLGSTELYDPGTRTFSLLSGTLSTPRSQHVAALLQDGRVLIADGYANGFLTTAELYDPTTDSFSPAGKTHCPGERQTATLLPNGKVLIIGGYNGNFVWGCDTEIGDLYDPTTGTFTPTGGSGVPQRNNHTATLLQDEIVLIAGGRADVGHAWNSAALYDPSSGIATPTGSMSQARISHEATLLQDGRVLITGGRQGDGSGHWPVLASAELYDPATGTFSPTGDMTMPRSLHQATLLDTGEVLISGGETSEDNTFTATGELYDPITGSFSPITATMSNGRRNHTATKVLNGDVLIAGGDYNVGTQPAPPTPLLPWNVAASADLFTSRLPSPDLLVSALSAATGASPTLSLTDTTRNQGGAAAAASTTKFYLSADGTLDGGDTLLGGRGIPGLAAAASSAGSSSVTVPGATAPGAYYVIAKADADNVVTEIAEGNNTKASRSLILRPDLTVRSLSPPSTAAAGATISVTDTTKNQGWAAAGLSGTNLYVSSDAKLDAGDVFLGTRGIAGLNAAATSAGATSVTIPAGAAPGTYYILAKADGGNVIQETVEKNNIRKSSAVSVGPDLTVFSLSAPSSAVKGATVSVTDTIKNQGGGAAGVSTTRIYLSTDKTLDGDDVLVGSRGVPGLAPGASSSGAASVAIPASTATGTFYLIAKADGDDAVVEAKENNNVKVKSITVSP
ncbi:MAG: hypothetical protein HYX76_05125 [Acidobacteria bacterium]|nr:hypothetical protein [Acidobacteriota bacterium]